MNRDFHGLRSLLPGKAAWLIPALVLLLSACATHKTPDEVVLAPSLTGLVQIETLTESNDNGLLRVKITGRNMIDRVLTMDYQFDWLDKDGQMVDSVLSRKTRFTADRLRYFTIDGIAPSADVVSYRLYIDERAR
ncbi:MAG: DUF1425 domain-containing protein [Halomonadaceae bacterium]|nr:MAG: DUF1425 domain-containing protein [Halomonadaceae bacterium]